MVSTSPPPVTPHKSKAPDSTGPSKRSRPLGGGGGGSQQYDGTRVFYGFPTGIFGPEIPSFRSRELLTAGSSHRLVGLLGVTGYADVHRVPHMFHGLLRTFADPPQFYFFTGPVNPDDRQHNIPYSEAQVKQALDAASPDLAAVGGWNVIQCPDNNGLTRLHANLVMARFAGNGPDNPGFLRVCVSSANCSTERGLAFDAYWVQDFPITAAPGAAPTDLPYQSQDRQPFRLTLRCFMRDLVRTRFAWPRDRKRALGPFVRLLQDVDFRGANATLLSSVPGRAFEYAASDSGAGPRLFNAGHGLAQALRPSVWPAEARNAPVTYLTGALGNMAESAWLRGFVECAMAGGAHGSAVDEAGDLRLRVVWPTNIAGFHGNETVARVLAHNWRYGEDGSAFPHELFYKAEPKPTLNPELLSHIAACWRVAPNLSRPVGDNEIRGWMAVGSANIARAAWGHAQATPPRPPTNFELSVLVTTPDSCVAASWLDALPLKLPGGLSKTGLEQPVVDAQPYPAPSAQVVYTRTAHHSPYHFAYDSQTVYDDARADVLGQGNAP